ncbi:MAG: hypothetical protein JSU92_10505, partial [Deltaproteobacteria bacterium]
DENGQPVVREYEQLRFALCVPKGIQPAEGWPILTYAHGTGGDYKTFVRNGVADYLGSLGIASISIDQPLHGTRLGAGGDPEMDFYNFLNPLAGRDNSRQSAIDSLVLNRMAPGIEIDTVSCSTCTMEASFDPDRILFMGHSQGAHTGGLFLGVEPEVKGAVLSGAGGGLAITLLTKTDPYDVKALMEDLLGIEGGEEELDLFHPIINIIQTYIEPADPLNYAPYYILNPLFGVPKSIFISEGFLDTQVTPLTAEALATAIGASPIEPVYHPILGLALRGLEPLSPPVTGNITGPGGMATAGVLQYPEGNHWVLTNDVNAKNQWGMFLQSLVDDGLATIVAY